jgi:hypothetical protein
MCWWWRRTARREQLARERVLTPKGTYDATFLNVYYHTDVFGEG